MTRLWPFILTTCFGIVFMGIADLAWLTAIGTTEPWFTSATSSQMYTATLTTATLATLILASLAANRLANLESKARVEGDAEFRAPQAEAPLEVLQSAVVPQEAPRDPDGLDQILSEIGRFATGPLVEVREKPAVRTAPLVSFPPEVRTDEPRERAVQQGLRRARRLVWQTVLGPLVMLLIFLAISGAMLPGSGEFAQMHYQLNTGLVLFLGYGWPFLVAWTVAAIVILHVTVRTEAQHLQNLGPRPPREGLSPH
jgi:hypothetical protein